MGRGDRSPNRLNHGERRGQDVLRNRVLGEATLCVRQADVENNVSLIDRLVDVEVQIGLHY